MKGDERVVKKLDELLCDELTAIMQYMVHAEMCANWGYQRLHQAVEKRARQEMHHAEELIARIIFLEGTPTVSRLNQIHVGADVPKQLQSDKEHEHESAGEALAKLREVTDNYTLPPDACPTFRAMYEELQRMEADLHQHIDLENNILFPRAIELEGRPGENGYLR